MPLSMPSYLASSIVVWGGCFVDSYGVYVKALPSLSYDSVRQYAVLISCTDTKTPVTDTLTIFVTKNNPPSFDNLPGKHTSASLIETYDFFLITSIRKVEHAYSNCTTNVLI